LDARDYWTLFLELLLLFCFEPFTFLTGSPRDCRFSLGCFDSRGLFDTQDSDPSFGCTVSSLSLLVGGSAGDHTPYLFPRLVF